MAELTPEKEIARLWIDDAKPAPDETWAVARTYEDAVTLLRRFRYEVVAIDHDLGGARTGYDVLCLMEQGALPWPQRVMVISWNPVGRKRMAQLLDRNSISHEMQPFSYGAWDG